MRYNKGGVIISVSQVDGFGKKPSLWIGTEDPNQLVKVASFGSEDKANMFCKWLDYICGASNDRGTVGLDG